MTTRKYSSRSQQTTLTGALNSTATSVTVVSASALLGGATITVGETFTVVINPDTALEEIVDVTAVASNTLTITRGVENAGTGQSHSAGAVVRHMAIGRDFREANTHIENITVAHGVTLANLVKTTDTSVVTESMIVNGAVGAAKIATASVTEEKIATSAVNASKIASDAITTVKIQDGAVTTAKVLDGAITSAKILDGTIVAGDIASNAITSVKIVDANVTEAKIADGAVTSAKIANDTIVNADINTNAGIAKSKLNLGGTITSADLVDGTIVAADIADGTITAAKMVADPYARANHTGTQTASTISDFDTQVRTNRLDQMATPTASVAMGSQKITGLGLATTNGDAVSVAYLTSVTGVANGIAPLDGSGKIPTDHLPALAIAETFVVNSQSNMLALTAQTGDIAVRTDVNKSFILTTTPASTLGNWQELLTPTDAVQSVDGSTGAIVLSTVYLAKAGGTMTGNLTLVGAPSSDLHAATKAYVDTVAGSATAAAASAAAAASSYDSFDDRYLGSKSTAPSVDNDGNALITGAIYWNSVTNAMYAWTGTEWGSISSTADIYRFRFTASGGETSKTGTDDNGLTLTYIPGKEQVYLNGVLLARTSDYNATNGTSITGLASLTAGDILEVITFTAFELADSIARSLFDAKGDILVATSADTPGKLTAGTDGHYLQADSTTATGLKWSAVSGYSAPTIGSTSIASGATVTTLNGVTDIVLTGPGSITDELTLLLMGAI